MKTFLAILAVLAVGPVLILAEESRGYAYELSYTDAAGEVWVADYDLSYTDCLWETRKDMRLRCERMP